MKTGLWLLTGILLLIWTAGMALLAQGVPWLAVQLPLWAEALPPLNPWPWPAWLSLWVDPVWLQTLQPWLLGSVQWLQSLLPSLEGLASLLGLAIWLLWGLGLLLLLGLAVAGQVLLNRRWRRVPS